MTGKPDPWTRRQFSQAVAASSLLRWKFLSAAPPEPTGIVFVGSSPAADAGAIHVFYVSGSRWSPIQTVPAAAPTHLVSHPTLPVLYAVHAVGLWNHLPRGAISAYAMAPATGQLTLLHTQPLSLSATYPRHAAISPDGRYLIATAERGGLYNLLPIAPNGTLQAPSAIRKECGLDESSLTKTAAPRQAIFHPEEATILSADPGQETISAFSFDHETIHLRHRIRAHPGAGPFHIALSLAGDSIYALHAVDGSISVHRMGTDRDLRLIHARSARKPGPCIMAMHPSGLFLVTAGPGVIQSFSIHSASGRLSKRSAVATAESFQVLTCSSDGTHLLGIAQPSGRILRLAFEASSGSIGKPECVAHVDFASSLLFHPAQL